MDIANKNFILDMTRGYAACALWSSSDDNDRPLDGRFAICDIHEDTFATMTKDCRDFVQATKTMLEHLDESDPERVGHDFWLTRNGHGAGFWDRGYGRLGQYLSDVARSFGEVYIYAGDDEKVYA